jgi:hypothetical protein
MSAQALPKQVHQQAMIRHQLPTKPTRRQTAVPSAEFRRHLATWISCHVLPRKVLQQVMFEESRACLSVPHWLIYGHDAANKVLLPRRFVNHPGN